MNAEELFKLWADDTSRITDPYYKDEFIAFAEAYAIQQSTAKDKRIDDGFNGHCDNCGERCDYC